MLKGPVSEYRLQDATHAVATVDYGSSRKEDATLWISTWRQIA